MDHRLIFHSVSVVFVLLSCGRTEPLRYSSDGGGESRPRGADGGLLCVDGSISLLAARPVVMLAVDRSGSMAQSFLGSGTSKWNQLRTALRQALPAWNETFQVGLQLFPSGTLNSCGVNFSPEFESATDRVEEILTRLDATAPVGSTPTADAIDRAGAALAGLRSSSSAKALIIATDGAPGCNSALNPRTCVCPGTGLCTSVRCLDDFRTVERVRSLASDGIPSWVIGLRSPGDALFVDVLNRMADAGGRARVGAQRFFSAGSQQELTEALTEIGRQVGRCRYLTTAIPDVGGSIEFRIDGQFVKYDQANGWAWADVGNGELVLSGSACDLAEKFPLSALSVVIACANP
jgi:hypothetical protein